MEESRFNRTSVSFLIIGLIVGFVIGFISSDESVSDHDYEEEVMLLEETDLLSGSVLDADISISQEKEPEFPTVEIADVSITVSDQDAGDSVVVSNISSPKEIWVAVREDRGGELWSILGARKVGAGSHQKVTVPLLRGTEMGQLYHVVAYEEDGDGMFDHKADTLVSKNGSFYIVDFTTK